MQDYAEAVVFVFRVDSEGASSVEVCARVCVCVLETFSFSTTPYSELQFEAMVFPIYVCELDGSSGTGI